MNAQPISLDQQLLDAVTKGQARLVKPLLRQGASPRATHGPDGRTALRAAAEAGLFGVVQVLVEAGAPLNACTSEGFTAMHLAAREQHSSIVGWLILEGASPSIPNDQGATPLYTATRARDTAMMELLLQGGAAVDAPRPDGRTPLHWACNASEAVLAANPEDLHCAAASLLLRHKAAVNSKDKDGYTALHAAAACGSLRLVRLLLGANADVTPMSVSGCTPLHEACEAGHQQVAVELLERGADPGIRNADNDTALHLACRHGHAALVQRILQYTDVLAEINTAGALGHTPLTMACYGGGQPELLRVLLASGADTNLRVQGMTPLQLAVESLESSDRTSCLEVLLAGGAGAVDRGGVSLEGADVLQQIVQQGLSAAVPLLACSAGQPQPSVPPVPGAAAGGFEQPAAAVH
jgi:ankyrin